MQTQKISSNDQLPINYIKGFYEWPDSWMGFDEDLLVILIHHQNKGLKKPTNSILTITHIALKDGGNSNQIQR